MPFTSHPLPIEVESRSNDELDKLKALVKYQEKQMACLQVTMETRMQTKIDELKTELKREINEVDIGRAEVSFKFELANVSKFFQVDCNEQLSERFWARDVQWSLCAMSELEDGPTKTSDTFLGLYLYCHNDELLEWSCKTKFSLIVFNHQSANQNVVVGLAHTFKANFNWGQDELISYSELADEKKGFIQDNKIVLGVQLKAEPVIRIY